MFDGRSLATAPIIGEGRSGSISAENPTGARGAGGAESSRLGPGRKGRAFVPLGSGETVVLADIEGAGVIEHVWITVPDQTPSGGAYVLRDLVLRASWDGESSPSVEVPLGDFFCNGFGTRCLVSSLPIFVAPTGGMNCYLPMPFGSGARLTLTNEHAADLDAVFYQVDYVRGDAVPDDAGRLHAQWRRTPVTEQGRDHVILDGVVGRGKYVGTFLAVAALERYWWGEGEMRFFIDGDDALATIVGTGTEDYFGGAWGFQDRLGGPDAEPQVITYSGPYLGYPFHSVRDETRTNPYARSASPMHGLYRWHIPDPIRFDHDLRVTLQQIGHDGQRLFERSDDVSSVAYWYQLEPHAAFPQLATASARRPR